MSERLFHVAECFLARSQPQVDLRIVSVALQGLLIGLNCALVLTPRLCDVPQEEMCFQGFRFTLQVFFAVKQRRIILSRFVINDREVEIDAWVIGRPLKGFAKFGECLLEMPPCCIQRDPG